MKPVPSTIELNNAALYPASPLPVAAAGNFYAAARSTKVGRVARWAFTGLRIVSAIALLGGGDMGWLLELLDRLGCRSRGYFLSSGHCRFIGADLL